VGGGMVMAVDMGRMNFFFFSEERVNLRKWKRMKKKRTDILYTRINSSLIECIKHLMLVFHDYVLIHE
jgi:hypothetical protein